MSIEERYEYARSRDQDPLDSHDANDVTHPTVTNMEMVSSDQGRTAPLDDGLDGLVEALTSTSRHGWFPILALVSGFLPWVQFNIGIASGSFSLIQVSDGWIFMVLALAALGTWAKASEKWLTRSWLALGALMTLLSVAYGSQVSGTGVSWGIGLILGAVCSIGITYFGYRMWRPSDAAKELSKESSKSL